MDTLYIFEQASTGYPLVGLSDSGDIVVPFAFYDITEILPLTNNRRVVFVIHTERVTLHRVLLPKLPDKKANIALYYALEEMLASPQESVHLAYERRYVEEGYYRVIVIQQAVLRELLQPFEEQHILFDAVTIDWFALAPNERFIREKTLLIHDDNHFSGALCDTLANQYLMNDTNPDLIETCQSSLLFKPNQQPINQPFAVWASLRLRRRGFIDLQQHNFISKKNPATQKVWYLATAASLGLWLLSLLLSNSLALHYLNKSLAETDAEIAQQYFHFFPHAASVINPRFRIAQLLKTQKHTDDTCFILMNALAKAIKKHHADIESVRFEQNTLRVALESQDIRLFDNLEQTLAHEKVHVSQSQVTTHGDKVTGILELRL